MAQNLGTPYECWGHAVDGKVTAVVGKYRRVRWRIKSAGLLNSTRMLPIAIMPLEVQLRLGNKDQTCFGMTNYSFRNVRMCCDLVTVSSEYFARLKAHAANGSLVINFQSYDIFYKAGVSADTLVVCPSNRQSLAGVFGFLHNEGAQSSNLKQAHRSAIQGIGNMLPGEADSIASPCLTSYQYSIGNQVQRAVEVEDRSGKVFNAVASDCVNQGIPFYRKWQEYAKKLPDHAMADVNVLGSNIDYEGRDARELFLCKYFTMIYDAQKSRVRSDFV